MSVTKLNILTSSTLYTLLPTSAGNGDDEYVDCDHYMMADIMMLAVNTTRIQYWFVGTQVSSDM